MEEEDEATGMILELANHFSGVRGSKFEKMVASLSRTKPTGKVNSLDVHP
jgi:hypothetical protein